ncbi:MAG: hypothetical protein K2Y32_12335 [Candidatus Obscuribacterales bacterium]|nr:hypothetical protein [Candidatus Obscuribacterales bacterium]
MLKESQIKNLWLGLTVLTMIGIYPPWKEYGAVESPLGFASIFSPPSLSREAMGRGVTRVDIDFSRLSVELFLGLATAAVLVVSAGSKEAKGGRESKPVTASPVASVSEKTKSVPANMVLVELPETEGLGEILVESEDDPDYWEPLCQAKGQVLLPRGKKFQLELAKDRRVDTSLLKRFPTGYLFSIDGSDAKLTDDDAEKLAMVQGLKELDLSGTPISSKAIEKLRSLKSLEKLWLDNTLIDDASVPFLISLGELKKLSLQGTSLNDLSKESLKKDLPSEIDLVV